MAAALAAQAQTRAAAMTDITESAAGESAAGAASSLGGSASVISNPISVVNYPPIYYVHKIDPAHPFVYYVHYVECTYLTAAPPGSDSPASLFC